MISSPVGLVKINPALPLSALEDLLVYQIPSSLLGSFVVGPSLLSSLTIATSVLPVILVMKYAKVCGFMLVRRLKLIACSPSSTAHFSMRPDFSGFSNICCMGVLVSTSIRCVRKYNLNFLVALTRDIANFSISQYSISTPYKTQIRKFIGIKFIYLLVTNIALMVTWI